MAERENMNENQLSDMDTEMDSQEKELHSKKKSRNPERWRRNVSKIRKNLLLDYDPVNGGATVPAKEQTLTNCTDGCVLQIQNPTLIFEKYRSLGDYNQQNIYLMGLIHKLEKQRVRVKSEDRKKNRCTFQYTITEDDILITLCRKAFIDVFCLSERRLEKILKAVATDDPNLVLDKRGKHVKKAISSEQKDQVRKHIKKYLSEHYSNRDPDRKHLSSNLSIHRMYLSYREDHSEPVKEWLYRDIFLRDFNQGHI